MAREHYAPYRWVQSVVAALALWLMTSPFTLGYESRARFWSDILSGAVALGLALLALAPQRGWASWANALVGLWLLFAPLVFWTPDPAAYANDTLVGAMLVTFAFLGALVIVFAAIATAEVGRAARFPNVPLGAWLLVAPWFLGGGTALARWNSVVAGLLVLLLALPLGTIRDHYGGFDRYVTWGPFGRHPAGRTA